MSARRHEPRTRGRGSYRRILDLWFSFGGAGGTETDSGGVLVMVRVVLPLLAYLGHNALYILAGLICFHWLKSDEEESTSADEHSRVGYNFAALLFFFLFLDNLLRREEGQGWDGFWPCSGRLHVVVLYFVLSLLAHFAFWSRIVSGLNQERA